MRFSLISLTCLICAIALPHGPVHATEVYRWTDQQGTVHFGNRPPAKDQAQLLFKTTTPPPATVSNKVQRKTGSVERVIDGDTLVLKNGYRLRLSGINAPEIAQAGKPGQRGGEAARQYLEQLVKPTPSPTRIEYEPAEEIRDRYGRYLVHLFDQNGSNINQRLLEEGLVHASISPPNLRYIPQYLAAEKQAREARRGIWAQSDYRTFNSHEIQDSRNQFRRVEMVVSSLENSSKHHILRSKEGFSVRIPKHAAEQFPALNHYLGKRLIVRGWVRMHRNELFIEAAHPLQIELLDKGAS